MLTFFLLAAVAMQASTTDPKCTWATLDGNKPLVIAHRGASGERPEHTIAAYQLAIEQGADVIEPDLVMTIDGVLSARHDRYLSTTTDVASRPEFADRRRNRPYGSGERSDWWTDDFTLAEIKTLRAVQPRPDRPQDYNGQFEIPTFAEVVALAKAAGVAIYPETKAPAVHAEAGLDMETAVLTALSDVGWTDATAPVFIQSFEPEILRSLNTKTEVPLVQLVYELPGGNAPEANIPLADIIDYADGVGPSKVLVVGKSGDSTGFVAKAHRLGLFVHPWTFRDDQPPADGIAIDEELDRMILLGVDGLFTDFPNTAVKTTQRSCA